MAQEPVNTALSLWRGEIRAPRKRMADIVAMVAAKHGISIEDLIDRANGRRHVRPRQEAFFLMHQSGRSLAEIGRFFNLHHTAILHGVRRYREGGARTEAAE